MYDPGRDESPWRRAQYARHGAREHSGDRTAKWLRAVATTDSREVVDGSVEPSPTSPERIGQDGCRGRELSSSPCEGTARSRAGSRAGYQPPSTASIRALTSPTWTSSMIGRGKASALSPRRRALNAAEHARPDASMPHGTRTPSRCRRAGDDRQVSLTRRAAMLVRIEDAKLRVASARPEPRSSTRHDREARPEIASGGAVGQPPRTLATGRAPADAVREKPCAASSAGGTHAVCVTLAAVTTLASGRRHRCPRAASQLQQAAASADARSCSREPVIFALRVATRDGYTDAAPRTAIATGFRPSRAFSAPSNAARAGDRLRCAGRRRRGRAPGSRST